MDNNKPFISVIIPCYNASLFLNQAIESVLNQTYKNFEVIIVNDGSTDNTEEIIKAYRDNRVIYLKQETNKGPSAARNTGLKYAKGEYIAFLDADDIWMLNKLEKQVDYVLKNKVDIVTTNGYILESKTNKSKIAYSKNPIHHKKSIFKVLIKHNFIFPSTVLIKKETLQKAGFFDENLQSSEDYYLWLNIAFQGGTFAFIDEPLFFYRKHPRQLSKKLYTMYKTRLTVLNKLVTNNKILLLKYPLLMAKIVKLYIYLSFIDLYKNFSKKRNV